LSEQTVRLGDFLVEHPYAGLIEVMDKTGLTSEPVLAHIGYDKLSPLLRQKVYTGEMDLYQIWCLSILEPEVQEQFWKNAKDLEPSEFKVQVAETRRFYQALKFAEDFKSGPEALRQIAEIGEQEAAGIFARFMEVYPGLRNLLKEQSR
jgi:hypothetical protein